MCDEREQEFQDLVEFLKMLDFDVTVNGDIEIVPNQFTLDELPATIQNYLKSYFEYLEQIK